MNNAHHRIRSPLVALCAFLCLGSFAAAAELIRAPYLQLATPDSIYVVWRTKGPNCHPSP